MISLNQLDHGLENWHSVYKDTYKNHVTFSLEGRYRSGGDDDNNDDELPVAKKPINLGLAELYEGHIILLPYTFKTCLVVDYMYRYALQDRLFNRTCRICRVMPKNWDSTVTQSKSRLLLLVNKYEKEAA